MKCPKCQSDQLKVADSRPTDHGVRRRRECLDCGHRFSTMETEEQFHCQQRETDFRAFLDGLVQVIGAEAKKYGS